MDNYPKKKNCALVATEDKNGLPSYMWEKK
jgi:hypothetical protein